MKLFYCLIPAFLFHVSTSYASPSSSVALSCIGEVELSTDAVTTSVKKTGLDIIIDSENSTASIEGNFGCIATLKITTDVCANPYPITISDSAYSYYEKSVDGVYSGTSSFTISRYTGIMESGGLLTNSAQPRNWTLFMSNGDFKCSLSKHKF